MAVETKTVPSHEAIPLCELPEGCIANTLSLTSPRDACRLSLVGSRFRSAALSDDVWNRFLPADYLDVLGRSSEGVTLLSSPISRKELYLHLCDHPILIDAGTKVNCFARDIIFGFKICDRFLDDFFFLLEMGDWGCGDLISPIQFRRFNIGLGDLLVKFLIFSGNFKDLTFLL